MMKLFKSIICFSLILLLVSCHCFYGYPELNLSEEELRERFLIDHEYFEEQNWPWKDIKVFAYIGNVDAILTWNYINAGGWEKEPERQTHLTLIVPSPPKNYPLDYFINQIPGSINVSPADARGGIFRLVCEDGRRMAFHGVIATSSDMLPWWDQGKYEIPCYISMVYTDKDVHISGTGTLGTNYDLYLKKGWNPIYVWKEKEIRMVSHIRHPLSPPLYSNNKTSVMIVEGSEFETYSYIDNYYDDINKTWYKTSEFLYPPW